MHQKDFFKQLRDELHGHPLRDRFLEELKDHAEDLKGEKLDEENWDKRMSDPRSIKQTFMNIMNPLGKLFFVLEALLYGALSIPFTLFFYFNARNNYGWNDYLFFDQIGFWIISGFISFIFVYLLASIRFLELSKTTNLGQKKWISLVYLPGLITILLNCFFEINNRFGVDLSLANVISILMIYFAITGFSFLLAIKLSKLNIKHTYLKSVLSYIKMLAGIYFLGCILFRTIITYTPYGIEAVRFPDSLYYIQIFSPLAYWIEVNAGWIWTGLMNAALSDVSLFMAFYVPIFILLFIGGQSLWFVIKNKKWFSIRSLLVIYVLTLFFIHPQYYMAQPEFKVPYLHVSEIIEKREVGIFYPILKFFNASRGAIYKYDVGFNTRSENADEDIIIRSNTGKIYELNDLAKLNEREIKKVSYQTLFKSVRFSDSEEDRLTGFILPPDYNCVEVYCGQDDFAQKYIWKEKTLPIADLALSKDQKWALIVIPNRYYQIWDMASHTIHAQEVYLVKLK